MTSIGPTTLGESNGWLTGRSMFLFRFALAVTAPRACSKAHRAEYLQTHGPLGACPTLRQNKDAGKAMQNFWLVYPRGAHATSH